MEEVLAIFDLRTFDAWMIPVTMFLFFGFAKVMQLLVFEPYMDLFEAREAATTGASSSAEATLSDAARLEEKYERELGEARVAAMQKKMEQTLVAQREANAVVAAAEERAKEYLASERSKTDQELDTLRNELLSDVDTLASDIVDKMISGQFLGPQSAVH